MLSPALRSRATAACAGLVALAACTRSGARDAPLDGGAPEARADAGAPEPTGCAACAEHELFERVAQIAYPLTEISGIAASRVHEDVFYVHQDSGDAPRFFAIGGDGRGRGEFHLRGAEAVDWEDVAAGPCPDGEERCLFFADVGDNLRARASYSVFIVREPAPDPPGGRADIAFDAVRFTYPDGAHDAEAILVHPRTGDVFVVTKDPEGRSGVYRAPAPLPLGETVVLQKAADVTIPPGPSRDVTAGDIHPCAPRVVLRTYSHYYEYRGEDGDDLTTLLAATPRVLPVRGELQGEAVAYVANGRGMISTAETRGANAPLGIARCAP